MTKKKDLFEGIDIDVEIKGKISIDVHIDNDMFKELPATVQTHIINKAPKPQFTP